MADSGYDVASYTDVHPLFGTLDDVDRLLAAAHARGIRVLSASSAQWRPDGQPIWTVEIGRGPPGALRAPVLPRGRRIV